AKVAHQTTVGMSTACRIALVVAAVRGGPQVMEVIGNRTDVGIGVRVEVRPGLSQVPAILNDVKTMGDHAGFDKQLPLSIVIESPGIAGAPCEDFKLMTNGMIAPDAGIDFGAVFLGRAGLANLAVGEHAMASIEPAIGA